MVAVVRVPGLSGFLWNLAHAGMERKIVFAVEYFQIIELFVGSCGFSSCILSFLYKMPRFQNG